VGNSWECWPRSGHGYEDPGTSIPGTSAGVACVSSRSRKRRYTFPVDREPPFRSEVVDAASLAVIVGLAALVGLGVRGPVTAALALMFFTFVPGWAIVTNWSSAARISRFALSVLLSLAVCAASATTTLWFRIWPPTALFYLTAAVCAVAITSSLVRRRAVATPGFAEAPRAIGAMDAVRGVRPGRLQQAPNLAAPLVDGTQVLIHEGEDRVVPAPAAAVAQRKTTDGLVNVNTAGNAELETLPGIGKVLAQRIVDHRTANGPFTSVDELLNVRGVGGTILEWIRGLVTA
jgi:comEA protein